MLIERHCSHKDVVLDTNVLSHADNPANAYQESALSVLLWMQESPGVFWCLDDQGKKQPDPQTSVLFAEYENTLGPQSLAMILLARFMSTQRVVFSPRPGQKDQKLLKKLIPRNTRDRAVLGAAIGCQSKFLVSNDHGDFPEDVRSEADETWGVQVVSSDEAAA